MRLEYLLFVVIYALIGHLFFVSFISEELSKKVRDFVPVEMSESVLLAGRLICLFVWPFIMSVALFSVVCKMISERLGSGDGN